MLQQILLITGQYHASFLLLTEFQGLGGYKVPWQVKACNFASCFGAVQSRHQWWFMGRLLEKLLFLMWRNWLGWQSLLSCTLSSSFPEFPLTALWVTGRSKATCQGWWGAVTLWGPTRKTAALLRKPFYLVHIRYELLNLALPVTHSSPNIFWIICFFYGWLLMS